MNSCPKSTKPNDLPDILPRSLNLLQKNVLPLQLSTPQNETKQKSRKACLRTLPSSGQIELQQQLLNHRATIPTEGWRKPKSAQDFF